MLFRIFGSKAELFEKAVFEPFAEFVSDFIARWEARGVESFSEQELAREYIQGLYEILREHRELLMAILSASAYGDGLVEWHAQERSPISEIHDRLQGLVRKISDQLGYEDLDAPVFTRVVFGTIVGVAALDDWLFPTRARISTPRVLDEVLALALCRLTKARGGGAPRRTTSRPDSGKAPRRTS
jgi:AcrR family transcriptional regulator